MEKIKKKKEEEAVKRNEIERRGEQEKGRGKTEKIEERKRKVEEKSKEQELKRSERKKKKSVSRKSRLLLVLIRFSQQEVKLEEIVMASRIMTEKEIYILSALENTRMIYHQSDFL